MAFSQSCVAPIVKPPMSVSCTASININKYMDMLKAGLKEVSIFMPMRP